ncbi:hypothetical protein CR152_31530 [Massilia violaceinigra]|uniref:Uncharacterized protein n=1 Tax=Massilia violaceinigra TaxID=2045208 RepID=A0A2D2DU85_9BURK|nr:hypothetical protein [Massilia violaceinigra]ATQ78544.1 hypothetical protein CR152_31530 [Massilia violaceinigra]
MNAILEPISASRLDAYLDQTEAALEQQDDAELDPELIQAGLKTSMDGQRFRADTLGSVRRLFRLWLRAGDPGAASRVIDIDGREALAALPAAERPDWELSLAFWRLEPLVAQRDDAALHAALDAAFTVLTSLPGALQYDKAWEYLEEQATQAGAHALSRRCLAARNALQHADPERAAYRAWDDALMAARAAQSFALEGQDQQATDAAARAIDSLAKVGADQDIDHNDWLRIGHALFTIVPASIARVVGQVRALTPASTVFFARRDIDVRIARLEALTLHHQGVLDQALARLGLGRTIITGDADDRYSAVMLDWLLEAGKHEDAARLAFESVFHERQVSAEHGVRTATRAVSEGLAGQPYWQLALAYAGMADDTMEVRGDESEAAHVRRHLALARGQARAHPAIDAVEGLFLIKSAGDYHQALPLLEAAARDLSLANSDVLFKLWVARIRVHGAQAALEMPFVPASSAGSCYNLGVTLDNDLDEQLPDGVTVPQEALEALAARYYETGLARFEAFVMSGEGNARDGHAHTYSMLCNNLAIHYRCDKSDPGAALPLHHKGISASPFSEHYQGVMSCHRDSGNDAAMIDSGDQLWHYSADHGYSRHDPTDYVDDVVAALHRLGRNTDIAIWLQRLDEWWDSVEQDERAGYEESYVRALASVLYHLAHTQPDDAMLRLDAVLPRLRAAASPYTTRMAAHTLRTAGQFERAQAMYAEALGHVKPGESWHESQRQAIIEGAAECKRMQRAAQPWWKVW